MSENFAYVNVIDGKEANKEVALLTFDDGPNEHTLEIAQALAEADAPAIFFVNSMYLEDQEGIDILTEVHEMGFAIGNHSHTHPSLPSLSEEKQTEEILTTSDMVEEIIGTRPRFFRAPFGQNTDHSKQVVKDDGMALMNWTYGYDWEADYREPDALADIMVNTNLLVPGSNLLMHDREWTKEAVPAIIDGLREKGYELLDPELIISNELESEDVSE
ncbi:MAG: polysaccharide deacetylase family protein [Alkalibacterium sp.]|nr:polysaccharide deacetylase family protein [Alkalibacterium sp.]